MVTKSRVAMQAEVAKTDESNDRGSSWPPRPLLPGVWVGLGLAFVWLLVWNTYDAYDVDHLLHTISDAQRTRLMWSFVATTAALGAWLGIWRALVCHRHHQRTGDANGDPTNSDPSWSSRHSGDRSRSTFCQAAFRYCPQGMAACALSQFDQCLSRLSGRSLANAGSAEGTNY